MLSILTQVASFATTWFEGKKQKAEAKAMAEAAMEKAKAAVYEKKALSDENWDMTALQNSQSSWKDEYLLLVFSVPFVMAFIPQLQEYVKVGFEVLENTPEWYRWALAIMISSSFGVRSFLKIMKR